MNKPYICHNCTTEFDVWSDDDKEEFDTTGKPHPEKVRVKCPGCYAAGYTDLAQSVYVINLKTMQLIP